MKQNEIKHILDKEESKKEKELIFTHTINITTGEKTETHLTNPEYYKHVKHITGNIYYAYGKLPEHGYVQIGEFK